MYINKFSKILHNFAFELQKINTQTPSAETRLRILSNRLTIYLKEFEHLESQAKLRGNTKAWKYLKHEIDFCESALNSTLQDQQALIDHAVLKQTLQTINKVKQITSQHLSALVPDLSHVEQQLESQLPKIEQELEKTAAYDPQDHIQRQLNLLSKLKNLKDQINALNPDEVNRHSNVKAELGKINHLIDAVQKTFDVTAVGKVRKEEVENHQLLKEIRKKAYDQAKLGVSAKEISNKLSNGISDFVSSLYEQGINQLGKPPCEYCLVVFGSLARQESGPYPDLDNMLIIEKKTAETLHYFTKLNQYVADRVYRLGESETLGKSGLRFCQGDLNPEYLRYDFRYAENPRKEYILSMSDPIKDKRETLAKNTTDLHEARKKSAKDKVSQLETEQLKLTSELLTLKGDKDIAMKRKALEKASDLELDKAIREILSISNSDEGKMFAEKRDQLQKITGEIENIKKEINPTPDLYEKLNQLQEEQEKIRNEIEEDENKAHGGMSLLFVEASKNEPTLYDANEIKNIKNLIIKEKIEFLQQGVVGEGLPIFGNKDLYTQYSSLLKADSALQKQSLEAIKKHIQKEKEETISPVPSRSNTLPEVVHIKHELYRFPQFIVAQLANYSGIKKTNTFERIQALCDKNVIDSGFTKDLLKAMDQLVRLRIIAQTTYHEEFEFVTTCDWTTFNQLLTKMKQEVEDLKKNKDDIKKEIDECKKNIIELKANAATGDKTAEVDQKTTEEKLKKLETDIQKLFYFEILLNKDFQKLEKKEFKQDPKNPGDRIKEPTIPQEELDLLVKETLPTLHELFLRADQSISGSNFDINAFKK